MSRLLSSAVIVRNEERTDEHGERTRNAVIQPCGCLVADILRTVKIRLPDGTDYEKTEWSRGARSCNTHAGVAVMISCRLFETFGTGSEHNRALLAEREAGVLAAAAELNAELKALLGYVPATIANALASVGATAQLSGAKINQKLEAEKPQPLLAAPEELHNEAKDVLTKRAAELGISVYELIERIARRG